MKLYNDKPVPVRRGDALLIIDCINDLDFSAGKKVLPWALKLAPRLKKVRAACHRHGIPVIYANDNFGHWHSQFSDVYSFCTRAGAPGRELSRSLKPTGSDLFILKPRHSAFFCTALAPLLQDLKIRRLILSGISTNMCVLFTAHDAHMQNYKLIALSDCCAAESDFDHDTALAQLKRFCHAAVCRGDELKFSRKRNRR